MAQTGIAGVYLATVYHDWMKGNEDEGKKKGESSSKELHAILEGRAPLPSGADLILDVDTIPDPLDKSEVIPWPKWTVRILQNGSVVSEDVLTNDRPEGEAVRIQAPETPGSVWQRSLGYRLILKGPVVSERSSLTVDAEVGEWRASTLIIPWVSRA